MIIKRLIKLFEVIARLKEREAAQARKKKRALQNLLKEKNDG